MNKFLLKFYLYGSLGFTTEMIFTAAQENFHRIRFDLPLNLKLDGHSYLWMFFIYGMGSVLFPLGHKYIAKLPFFLRLFVMAIGIFVIEFTTGFLLDKLTGHCPWQYSGRFSVLGYIRLDYLPAWMFFGFVLEQANAIFDRMVEHF